MFKKNDQDVCRLNDGLQMLRSTVNTSYKNFTRVLNARTIGWKLCWKVFPIASNKDVKSIIGTESNFSLQIYSPVEM